MVRVGNRKGDYQVDVADQGSIERLFRDVGPFDALVSLAGGARFKPIGELTDEDFEFSLAHKLMGQINLVRAGHDAPAPSNEIADEGSLEAGLQSSLQAG